ncbi:hypothetical protein HU230_0029635 [Bradyrhizobium quebecense]|uniref:Uncharacterized protein n=1 Tax=Bradyrhizobium quebecense TaxID=2748629 RepID=A0A973WJL1_9BRAD|nr:hypothetical protein [Bradyrhizobium quebecense]UGA42434.1 hypothetical protein HU230_0029635 [Bradyrhizobium quebecense]
MRRRDGAPLIITDGRASPLSRVDLSAKLVPGRYDEAWLQKLLFDHPELLPIEQIEPGFGDVVPLCRELPLTFGAGRSGAMDNVFATVDGGLVFVEAKLWRNPEARRAVVAQAMEYAAAIFRLNYEEFDAAVMRARRAIPSAAKSLYAILNEKDGLLDEAEFIDAISRNLKRGRAIIAVVGDGIREDLEQLVELLQSHAGHRFIFALIELGIYQSADNATRVITPSILAKTALIERGVVQIAAQGGGQIIVERVTPALQLSDKPRSIGLGEDEFYELLDKRDAGMAAALRSFLGKAEALGVTADWQRALNLKHPFPDGNPLNLGTIDKSGYLDAGPATWWGRTNIGREYNEVIAKLIGGFVREINHGKESAVRTASAKMPRLKDFLPIHEEAWLKAMSDYIEAALRNPS